MEASCELKGDSPAIWCWPRAARAAVQASLGVCARCDCKRDKNECRRKLYPPAGTLLSTAHPNPKTAGCSAKAFVPEYRYISICVRISLQKHLFQNIVTKAFVSEYRYKSIYVIISLQKHLCQNIASCGRATKWC